MKKLLVVLGFTLSLMSVKAGTLYWQIESSDSDAFAGLADTVAYAEIAVYDAGGNRVTAGNPAEPVSLETLNGAGVGSGDTLIGAGSSVALDLSGYDSATYSFGVELLNASGDVIGNSVNTFNYNDLLSSGYVSTTGLELPAGAGFTAAGANGGYAVPEPTSGLLLLMGGALLALRRRRQK